MCQIWFLLSIWVSGSGFLTSKLNLSLVDWHSELVPVMASPHLEAPAESLQETADQLTPRAPSSPPRILTHTLLLLLLFLPLCLRTQSPFSCSNAGRILSCFCEEHPARARSPNVEKTASAFSVPPPSRAGGERVSFLHLSLNLLRLSEPRTWTPDPDRDASGPGGTVLTCFVEGIRVGVAGRLLGRFCGVHTGIRFDTIHRQKKGQKKGGGARLFLTCPPHALLCLHQPRAASFSASPRGLFAGFVPLYCSRSNLSLLCCPPGSLCLPPPSDSPSLPIDLFLAARFQRLNLTN